MKNCIHYFLQKNSLNFNSYFNCYCLVTRKEKEKDKIVYSEKMPLKCIFQEESVFFKRLNTNSVREYNFRYEQITQCSNHESLKFIVKDFYFDNNYFEFEFIFVFEKYILDPLSIKKENFEAIINKSIYIDHSISWYGERKESEGKLHRVGDLRIKIEKQNGHIEEIDIFDINYFFVRL